MKSRRIPRRDLRLTEIGFGAAPVGNLGAAVSNQDAAGALEASWRGGVRYVDTAPHYGLGLAECRTGAAVSRWPREQFCLSTKVGRILEPLPRVPAAFDAEGGFAVPVTHRRVWDFSRDGVLRSLEDSLNRLGLDRIDIVLVHDPDDHWEQASTQAIPALVQLRDEGVIGAVGAGMNQSAMLARFVRETDVDVVMLAGRYTLLDQSAQKDLLPAAAQEGVAVIAAGVFNSGLLARETPDPAATFDYEPAPAQMVHRASRIARICADHGTTLPAAALHFVLAHPSVVSAVLGMRNSAQVEQDLELYAKPPAPDLWTALRRAGLVIGAGDRP